MCIYIYIHMNWYSHQRIFSSIHFHWDWHTHDVWIPRYGMDRIGTSWNFRLRSKFVGDPLCGQELCTARKHYIYILSTIIYHMISYVYIYIIIYHMFNQILCALAAWQRAWSLLYGFWEKSWTLHIWNETQHTRPISSNRSFRLGENMLKPLAQWDVYPLVN